MLNLIKKIVTLFILVFMASTVQASETFSHAVLSLPDDPRTEDAWSLVINTQDDWETFYNQSLLYMTFLEGTAPTAPILDFENYQVLAGGLGEQSTGGNLLVVNEVQELEASIAVHVLLVRPGSNCVLPSVISYPSTAILVRKTDKPFAFSISHLVEQCTESITPSFDAAPIILDDDNDPL